MSTQSLPPSSRPNFLTLALKERVFLGLLLAGFIVSALFYQNPMIAMWLGFAFASYSVVANDSIQTIGTFIASNHAKKWWILWAYVGGIFLVTMAYSWVTHDGDVTYQRLASKGFETAPTEFSYLQIVAPLFLLILTRLKMPVSTTFLILSCFADSAKSIGKVLAKSLSGYALAFVVAIVLWFLVTRLVEKYSEGEAHPAWRIAQWFTSGILWAVWLMQDAANVAVYLPRQLSPLEFFGFAGLIFSGLGVLFYLRGDRIQQIVTEKSQVVDVRAATLIDVVYAAVLYVFKIANNIPMSTTWVFLGLMAGREIAIQLRTQDPQSKRPALATAKMLGRDITFALLGLTISIILAMAINPEVRAQLLSF